ncbi:MAG: hypothetical protein ACSHWZ_16125 [Sulfitobacter sp.]
MKFKATGLVLCAFLASCSGGNPFEDTTDETDASAGDDTTGISRDGELPPGTESPSAGSGLFRSEASGSTDSEYFGNGYASSISYDGDTDTFSVDNLGFDGGNTYSRGTAVSSLANGQYAVYEGDNVFEDSLTQAQINQFSHRAIYGVSTNKDADGNPATQFAIVRTGAYRDYGFGGFVYQRSGSVTLPTEGQAIFQGQAAGIRDFNGAAGVQYSTGNMTIAIDFDDFNSSTGSRGDAVRGNLTNREIYDIDGENITNDVLGRINTKNEASLTSLPAAVFTVGPGVLDDNGELIGVLDSSFTNDAGDPVEYESGNYYAIVSGDDPDEIVGVMVLENNAEFDSVTVRDTSGFIVYR